MKSLSLRRGLSVLELVGCLTALLGGLWLGAIYLGIDVRQLTYTAMVDTSLIDKVPERWRPADPAPAAPSQKELATSVQQELHAVRQEISSLRRAQANATEGETVMAAVNPATKNATLEYWKQLSDVVQSQANLQVDAELAATPENATKVAALKARISRLTASAVQAIPTVDVDPAAVELGQELAAWYAARGALYEQAVQIWESSARSQSGQQVTQEWDQARTQHQNEGRLLNERVAAMRDSLVRRFGEGFAPLANL